jgi:hypothetical protein
LGLRHTRQSQPVLGRWEKESTAMKKMIMKAALLLAAALALPMSANAVEWSWTWTGVLV